MKSTFGGRLRLARNEKKRTQAYMAALVGVDVSTWHRWENNKSMPNLKDLEMIGTKCGISLDWLIMGIDTHAGVATQIMFMLDKLRPRETAKLLEWLEVRLESLLKEGKG